MVSPIPKQPASKDSPPAKQYPTPAFKLPPPDVARRLSQNKGYAPAPQTGLTHLPKAASTSLPAIHSAAAAAAALVRQQLQANANASPAKEAKVTQPTTDSSTATTSTTTGIHPPAPKYRPPPPPILNGSEEASLQPPNSDDVPLPPPKSREGSSIGRKDSNASSREGSCAGQNTSHLDVRAEELKDLEYRLHGM